MLAYAFSRGLSLVGTLALARLLAPDDLGAFFTGMVVVGVVNLLGDTGLGLVLVLKEELEPAFRGTVLVCMLAVAVTLAGVLTALAGPIGGLFGSDRVGDVIPGLALAAVFTTVAYFYLSLLQREMLFQRRFAGQFAQAIVYVGVAVPLAIADAGIWSLVAGMLGGNLASAVVLWRLTPRTPFAVDLGLVRGAYREARPFVSQAVTAFLSYNAHYLAVAGVLGSRAMGVYSMSFRLAELPNLALTVPVSQAVLPAYAQLRDEHERRRRALLTSLQYVALIGFPLIFGMAALADPFQEAVLGPKWEALPPILTVLAAWGAVSLVTGTISWFINASGGGAWLAKVYTAMLLIVPAAFAVAAIFDSSVAVGVLLLVGISAELVVLLRYVQRQFGFGLSAFVGALGTALIAGVALAAAGVAAWLLTQSAGAAAVVELTAGVVAGGAAYIGTIVLLDRSLLSRGVELARRSLESA